MTIRISQDKLLRVYRMMKSNPNKTFLMRDFNTSKTSTFVRNHLRTLEKLGLIISVPAVYATGARMLTRVEVMAWRLRK